jgi:uncharacterized repeat protein (TIGR01451 family)
VLLGAGVLLVAERSHGQRADAPPSAAIPLTGHAVIATAVPVTPETPTAPAPLPPVGTPPPLARSAPAMPGPVQQATYVPPDPPPPGPPSVPPPAPPASTSPAAPAPAAPIPSNGLMSGVLNTETTAGAPPRSAPVSASAALVSVEVLGPEQVGLGQPLAPEIVVRNAGGQPVAEVHVEMPLPPGARVLRADPPVAGKGQPLSWDLGALEVGAERRLKIEVQPGGAGEWNVQPRVTFTAGGLRARVVRPPFAVEMTADHDQTTQGGRVTFTIRVSNHGDAPVRNIKLTDTLPTGLKHPAGKTVGVPQFGDLQPGETRTIALETTAAEAGKFRNDVIAQADGGIEGRATLDITVAEPALTVRLEGPKQALTQRDLEFNVEVSNPGPAPAAKIRLIQALPPSIEPTAASTGANFDAAQRALIWTLADLPPGQRQRVTFRAKARSAGEWPMYTSVLAENVPETRAANVLRVEGAAALALEARAREERVAVGEETVYEMHVFNQGDAPCTGVRLTAWLPDEVTPLDAQGPMPGKVQQQQVQFLPLGQLPPRGDAVYRIRVRGQRPGKAHVRVELAADKERPVQSEISIQVNGLAPAPAMLPASVSAAPVPPGGLR